ncbi:MAG: molybdenum cofactor guanylyltransferase [Gammaproteobacteria bacterium]|nr:molybdenum cofactor guanylyltransferase [Gammaproteobacteria bacterium]
MPDQSPSSTTALILAGGQASRMGGSDKGLLDCAGRPLIAHVLARVAPCVDAVLISANRNFDEYRRYGYPVLGDAEPDYPGPLAGIARGLEHCTTDWLWVVPCDAPQVDAQLLARLIGACHTQKVPAAVPVESEQIQSTFALLHRDVLASLRAYLDQGSRAVRDWLRTLPAAQVECSDHPEWFVNLNTPEELAACAARLVDTAL